MPGKEEGDTTMSMMMVTFFELLKGCRQPFNTCVNLMLLIQGNVLGILLHQIQFHC